MKSERQNQSSPKIILISILLKW